MTNLKENPKTNFSKSEPLNGQADRSSPEPESKQPPPPQSSGKKKSMGLRGRLLLGILPTALIPLAVAGGAGWWVIHEDIEARYRDRLEKQSLLAGEATSQVLSELQQIPETVASNPIIISTLQDASRQIEAEQLTALPIEQLEQRFRDTKLFNSNPVLNNYLKNIAGPDQVTELFVTERNGLNVAYNQPTSDFVQRDETWWQEGKANGQWLGDLEYDESARRAQIDSIHAVSNPDSGEFLGVIKMGIPNSVFTAVEKYLEYTDILATGQVQVIDPSTAAVFVTVTNEGVIEREEIEGGDAVVAMAQAMAQGIDLAEAPLKASIDEVSTQYNLNQTEVNSDIVQAGQRNLKVAFAHQGRSYEMTTVPDTDWVAVSSVDEKILQDAGNELINVFALVGTILGLGAMAIAFLLARQLASPLTNVSQSAQKAAAGDLSVRAKPQGSYETQQLAESYNNLVERVQQLLKEQELVAERAQILANIAQATNDQELQTPLNQYLEIVRSELNVDRVVVYRFKPDWSGYIAGEAVLPQWKSALGDMIHDPCIPQNLREEYLKGRVVPTSDVSQAGFHPDHYQLMERLQIKANLVVPIVVGEELLYGLLIAHDCSEPHNWQKDEVAALQVKAEQLVVGLSGLVFLESQKQQREALEKEVANLMTDIENAADGDLTVRAQLMEGDIGIVADLFNAVVENLQDTAQQVKTAASRVSHSLGENEIEIRKVAEGAIAEAEEIQSTLNSVEAMNRSIQEVAQNAQKVASIADTALLTAQEGNQAMDQTVQSIQGLRSTVGETAKKMKQMGESAQKISQVVSLIDEISLKTSLLAINASVEAHRAGELGQGFTAVAEQVESLAEQSASAAKEIAQIVANIQNETKEAIETMEQGTSEVVESSRSVEETKARLAEVVARSEEINTLMQSISDSTVSQAETSQAVSRLMEQVAQSSQQRSETSKEVAQAIQETAQVAQSLETSVEQFKVEK